MPDKNDQNLMEEYNKYVNRVNELKMKKLRILSDLRKKIEVELKDKLLPELKDEPRAILLRQICPADNGFVFFFYFVCVSLNG